MSAPTFGGQYRPDLRPIDGDPGFYEDGRGGVYMADAPPSTNGARAELRALANGNGASGRATSSKLRRLDVAKMLTTIPAPVPWVVEGIAARGHLTMLAGKEKSGKSYLMLAFAVACAHGGSSVAGVQCHPAKVLIVDSENGDREIHRRLRLLGLDDAARFDVYAGVGFDLARDRTALAALLDERKPDLLVLDSYRSLWRGDENDTSSVSAGLDPLRGLCHERDIATVLIHHANRASGLYRGSSAIGASVEHLLLLSAADDDPDKRRRRLRNTGSRFALEADDRWLRIDADERLGCLLIDETEAYGQAGEDAPVAPVRTALSPQVEAALGDTPKRLAEIAAAVGRKPKDGTVRRVLAALKEAGIAASTEHGWTRCQGAKVPTPIGAWHLGTPADELADLGPERPDASLADALTAKPCQCEQPLPAPDDGEVRCTRCGHATEGWTR